MAPLTAGMVRPVANVTVEPPAVAETAPPPPHVVAAFGVAAITTPAGNVSVSGAVKVATVASGLDSVIVRTEVAPGTMVNGLKPFPTVGGRTGPNGTNAAQAGTVMEAGVNGTVTVPPNAKALPTTVAFCPIVIPAGSRIFPTNAVFAPSDVAPLAPQNTSFSQTPGPRTKLVPAPVVIAPPVDLKM